MTETAARLRRLGSPHARARAGAVVVAGAGVVSAIAAAGLALAPRLAAVVGAWLAIGGVVAAAAWGVRRVRRAAADAALGRLVEQAGALRAGSVVGLVTPPVRADSVSEALFAAADARAARLIEGAVPAVDGVLAHDTRRGLAAALVTALVGAALFVAASPGAARGGAAFWNPLRTWRDARAPVRLAVDRMAVRRGDTVTVTVTVPAATRATLWTRGPGEAWRATALVLDTGGRAVRTLGPLQADVFLRASSGGRRSGDVRIDVALPAFVGDLTVTARYPAYLGRTDEPLVSGPDTIPLPIGTELLTSGAASVPLAAARWTLGAGEAKLRVAGGRFEGRFTPRAGGTWRLALAARDGAPFEDAAPELRLRLVPDSAPVVALPVPGRDTTLPLSLRQPLVIDARDDHGLARLAVVSRRVSRTGLVGEAVRESLDVTGAGDRAIVQAELDVEHRGLLPGDTVRVWVEAWDNAPVPHRGASAELALRLPSMEELRAATREAARDVGAAADSVAAAQSELADRTRDLAQERSRDPSGAVPGGRQGLAPQSGTSALPFQATERVEEVARQQAAVQQRIEELARAVEEIARAARAAGIDDTVFQNRLREVQQLLERALSPELEARLRELQAALARLDPEATRQALQRLAEAQQELRRELERSQELFRRAATEGELASLAADAEDLRRRQEEWNREHAPRADSLAAAAERALAERADSLTRGLEQAAQDLSAVRPRADATPLAGPRAAVRRAQGAMERAAAEAEQGDARDAGQAGEEAADALRQLPDALRGERDSLAARWRQEAIAALDRALSETAELAQRQREVAGALRRGEAGATERGGLAAVEEGTAAIERQIRDAAGRHALVSPQLEAALGFAERQMRSARQQLEQADPNASVAAGLAEEALDALNATAYGLARTRSAVAGAKSGTGLPEAIEQLARLAGQQQGLAGDAQGLLPMMGPGGPAVMEQLRALAARQRALAEQLQRMQAQGGGPAATGALAREAEELARRLEAGRLDRDLVDRQGRLYHRLLDAGRTLTGPEPDEQKERVSRSATGDSVRLPGRLAPGATGSGPRVRYPTWEELSGLTPEQRRLVLEYFRRLNAPRP